MMDRNTTSPFGSKIGASSLILLTALNRDLELEFIVIASQFRSFSEPRQYEVHTMCVEYEEDLEVFYRVNKSPDPISVEDWMATGPLWKHFALA
jgi:hypothetical protein